MKVIVTGAGALLGQGIIRSLCRSSLGVYIVAVDPSPLSAGLYWADERHLVPRADDPAYLDRLRELLRQIQPDAVLIGTDVELPVLAAARHELEREFAMHVLVSSPEVVAIADDKYETYLFLSEHGFTPPLSCLPGGEERLVDRVGFPLIVKPRVGARAVGVHLVHDRSQLSAALKSVEHPVIQECPGSEHEEYTAGVLYFDGECRASIVMRRDLRDGNTYRAFVRQFDKLNREVRAMGEVLKPYGPANFQFRLSEGQLKVFEINARFSGTTPLRGLAGFNEVEVCLRRLLLGDPIEYPQLREVTILRHWSETVVEREALVGWAADGTAHGTR
jgi:carbamoyl-phosphate synthase large subunit